MFPIALQLYSVRDFSEKDFFATLEKVKKMGYDGVEFAGYYDKSPEEIRDFCKKISLIPISAHVSIDEMSQDPEKTFSNYSTIGCKYIAVPYLCETDRPGGEKFAETVKSIENLSKIAKKYGLTMLYHNHDFEFKKINGEYGLDLLYRLLSPEILQTELDLCWVNVGGENPSDFLRKYTDRAPVVHLKDFVMKNRGRKEGLYELIGIKPTDVQADEGDFAFRPIGQGVQDVKDIFKAAKDANSQWIVVEQDRECLGLSSLVCVEQSINYIKKIQQ